MEEFFKQGDKETQLGLAIGPMNDRAKVSIPDSQLGFSRFVTTPYMLAEVMVFRSWRDLAENIAENAKHWTEKLLAEPKTEQDYAREAEEKLSWIKATLDQILNPRISSSSPNRAKAQPKIENEDLAIGPSASSFGRKSQCLPKQVSISDEPISPFDSGAAAFESREVRWQEQQVREVKRWREDVAGKKQRELVLLYLTQSNGLAEKNGSSLGQPVLFRYEIPTDLTNGTNGHVAVNGSRENGRKESLLLSAPLPAEVSMDSIVTDLDSGDLDNIIRSLEGISGNTPRSPCWWWHGAGSGSGESSPIQSRSRPVKAKGRGKGKRKS